MIPLIIGHRGAAAVAPENTMAAFREAIAAGCDGIEFDVHLTRDGIPIIIHDNSLRRTAGLPARVADLTWAEIKQIDVGSWFTRGGKSFTNETVPSLEELLTLFEENDLLIVLEMKCESRSEHLPLAQACCRLVNAYSLKQRVIVECFDLAALPIVKSIDPEIKTAALFEPAFSLSDQRIVDETISAGASVLAPHRRLARQSLVEKAKLAGLQVVVWTVDDPSWIAHARSIGVDALITNDPAAMLAHR